MSQMIYLVSILKLFLHSVLAYMVCKWVLFQYKVIIIGNKDGTFFLGSSMLLLRFDFSLTINPKEKQLNHISPTFLRD